jgi:outer membrane receptor protein involved in Fe transport
VFDFDPQRLQLAALSFQDLADRGWESSLKGTVYWNQQDEGRVEVRTSDPTIARNLDDSQTTVGANLELTSFLSFLGSHRFVYGFDYSRDWIDSSREDLDLVGGTTTPRRGNFTDGSKYEIIAAYLQDRLSVSDYVTLTGGLRYSRFQAWGSESSPIGDLELDSTNDGVTGSASTVFHLGRLLGENLNLNLIGQFTQGFRAPNIEDISRYDDRGSAIEIPNQDLRPEKIRSYEIGLKHHSRRFEGSVFFYLAELTDLLERQPGVYLGLPFFDFNDNGIQDPDEPDVLQRQNVGKATVKGVELSTSLHLGGAFTLFGNYTYTRGDDELNDVPMRRIPPHFGTLKLRWSPESGRRPWAELVYQFAAAQRRLNPSDESDSRIGPDGTDGFHVLHLRGGMWLTEHLRASLALENVFDEEYKYHASGVFRPGRQLVAQAEYRF